MKPGLKVGSVLSVSFDMGKLSRNTPNYVSVQSNYSTGAWEILGSLCNGCTLVMRGSDWDQVLERVCTSPVRTVYD